MRAFLVVNCQSALVWLALRSCSQAAISSMRICLLGMRRSRHWDVRTPSSDVGQIEPAAVFWSVVPFEALDQAPGFDGRKGFVECSLAVDAEIVLDQNDGLGVREVDVGQVFQDASVIHGGMAICDLDVAPAFERSKHHEEIGGAIALVLVIETGRASRFHRGRHARFGNELLRGLVEANQRTIAVAWPRVDGQHVFHSGYERAVGRRRDDPVLAAMGLKSVFLSARPIVLSLARSTMPSSTTLFSNNRKVQRARPLGGLEQAKAISLASFSPSKIRATAGVARGLRLNTASKPSSTSCLRTR